MEMTYHSESYFRPQENVLLADLSACIPINQKSLSDHEFVHILNLHLPYHESPLESWKCVINMHHGITIPVVVLRPFPMSSIDVEDEHFSKNKIVIF